MFAVLVTTFGWEIRSKAASATIKNGGTTWLGFILQFVAPLCALTIALGLKGVREMRGAWSGLKYGLLALVAVWMTVFLYYLFIGVPREIFETAAAASMPTPPEMSIPPPPLSPPQTLTQTGANERGRADVRLEFVGMDKLQFFYVNDTPESANLPKRFFALWDLDKPFYYGPPNPNLMNPLPLAVKTEADFVFRHTKQGPQDVLDNVIAINHVRLGDRLYGFATVVCSNCRRERQYWIYFQLGAGGWYAEIEKPLWGKAVEVPKPYSSNKEVSGLIDRIVPRNKRTKIAVR